MHADATLDNSAGGNAAPADEQLAYNVRHAAKVLDLGVRTVWGLVHSGEIESFKVGAARRIARAALDAYIKGREDAAGAE